LFSSPDVETFESTCISRYANLHDSATSNVVQLTGSTYFDPVPLSAASSSEDFQAAGARRLVRKAKVLSAAARLTRDLVERGVQDDISGAQQRVSAETDAHAGARDAWGAGITGTPYNSMRHALRTLFGRLEIGNNADPFTDTGSNQPFQEPSGVFDWVPHDRTRDDPQCSPYLAAVSGFVGSGLRALDIPLALPTISARWEDVAPKTTSQAKAVALLDRAGVIFPRFLVDSAVAAGQLPQIRTAVMQVLEENAASDAGYDSRTEFLATESGKAIQPVFEGMSNDDMLFALERVFGAFQLVAQPTFRAKENPNIDVGNSHEVLTNVAGAAGLSVRASSGIDSLGGIVIRNGLPREDLAIDPFASLARLQHLSSCGVYPDSTGISFATSDIDAALGPHANDVTVFQNPFMLGEGIRRELAAMAEEAQAASMNSVADFARLAAAEVRAWAGPGTLLTEASSADPDHQNLYLVNISPKDLGVKSNAELGQRLVLVSSSVDDSAVVANCQAGLRKTCPDIPNPYAPVQPDHPPYRKATGEPTLVVVGDPNPYGLARFLEGLDTQPIKIPFPVSSASELRPGSFVVLLPKDGSPGQVLGWLRNPDSDTPFFAEAYSSEQRRLAAKVFGLSRTDEPGRSCTNFASLVLPRQYCVEGMNRDEFVPLANELNSNSVSTSVDDSWKSYLDIAQSAADKADQLGEELIKDGLESDLRKESATEQLGNLCGAYVSV